MAGTKFTKTVKPSYPCAKCVVAHRHLHQHSLYCKYCGMSEATVEVLWAIVVPDL